MIPKIIHYCWLSDDPYPEKVQHCIDSWKKVLPDYEIRLWDRKRFDLQSSPWVREAFEHKKYAFAADYIRCYALYTEGGIYLDSDVEVLKPFDDLLDMPYFMGLERASDGIEAATMGAEKGMDLFKYMLDYYDGRHYWSNGICDNTVMPIVMHDVINRHYMFKTIASPKEFDNNPGTLCVLPMDYFSPKKDEQLFLTKNTYSIHHYTASWRPTIYNTMRRWIIRVCGVKTKQTIAHILHTYFHKKQ